MFIREFFHIFGDSLLFNSKVIIKQRSEFRFHRTLLYRIFRVLFGARHSCRKNARFSSAGREDTSRTKRLEHARRRRRIRMRKKESEKEEEEVEVDRRRRRGRINRRESDSGQPNASRHCPRLFAPLSLSRGLPLRSCTLCICFKYRRSARSL